jgi:hypothetical protein
MARHRATQGELPGVSPLDRRQGRSSLSPKRPSEDTSGLADVFPYYAGFSYDWARSLLASQDLSESALVLDPWNGSGTTTLAAQHQGLRSIGIDRNPVANIVARLRANSLAGKPRILTPESVNATTAARAADPLNAWFSPDSVVRIRAWANSLVGLPSVDSNLAYVALFRAIRHLTRTFEGTNPTWVKRAKTEDELLTVAPADFDSLVVSEQRFLVTRIRESSSETLSPAPMHLSTALSSALPLVSNSVDAVLTSPPYLTRIDYAVAYTRELALLGLDTSKDRSLRSALMGTTLIRSRGGEDPAVGRVAANMLADITGHSSKASSGYYRKQALQYLNDLVQGLDEITRVAKAGAVMFLVVQDSYYKDVPVKLADICAEECELRGWCAEDADPYPVRRTLTSLNKSARKYKKTEVSETVITLRKSSQKQGGR